MNLRDLRVGDAARVLGYRGGARAYRKKLLGMGLTPGTEFRVIRFAPLGDPVEIRVRGFSLGIRRSEADALVVERLPA